MPGPERVRRVEADRAEPVSRCRATCRAGTTATMTEGVAARRQAGNGRPPGPSGVAALQQLGGNAAVARLLGDRPPSPPVVQRSWFRMSTMLDKHDEEEVAEIEARGRSGRLPDAFSLVVSAYPELKDSFQRVMELSQKSTEVAETVDNILRETFHDPLKAFTAAEVVDLLEEHPTIADAVLLLTDDDMELDALVEQFRDLQISFPFHSDVDRGAEEHRVYWGSVEPSDGNDVIVASNPKPLKAVLKARTWELYPLSPAVVAQLTMLRKAAKLALYRIGGNAKRGLKGSRTPARMNAFQTALVAITKVLGNLGGATHQATLLPPTNLGASAGYGGNSPPTEGKHVVADPLSINSATPGSKPTDGRLMTSIRNRAGANSKSYVQMHLLNDLVFGPGQLWNLTPGPKQSNVDMEHLVEDPLKRAVLGKGLVLRFEAKVTYKNDPTTASLVDINQSPGKYRFDHIDFKATQLEYDQAAKSWKTAAVQDPDVRKVNGARVNWRYGNLPPLTPKPKILDRSTTWQELVAVGVQPAAAKRIVAFLKKEPTWTPGGKNKQQELAEAVKVSDGQTRIPNITSWKATDVYWT